MLQHNFTIGRSICTLSSNDFFGSQLCMNHAYFSDHSVLACHIDLGNRHKCDGCVLICGSVSYPLYLVRCWCRILHSMLLHMFKLPMVSLGTWPTIIRCRCFQIGNLLPVRQIKTLHQSALSPGLMILTSFAGAEALSHWSTWPNTVSTWLSTNIDSRLMKMCVSGAICSCRRLSLFQGIFSWHSFTSITPFSHAYDIGYTIFLIRLLKSTHLITCTLLQACSCTSKYIEGNFVASHQKKSKIKWAKARNEARQYRNRIYAHFLTHQVAQ